MQKSEYFNISRLENNHWWYKANREFTLDLLDKFLPKKQLSILDLGCGTGGTTVVLQKYGRVTGIDVSPEAIKLAHRYPIEVLRQADSNHLPFTSSKFDLVVSLDVLYHKAVNVQKTVDEAFRVLRPGGIFLVRVPAFSFLKGAHDKVVHGTRRFSLPQLKKIITKAEFSPLRITYFNSSLFLPALLFRKINFQKKSDIQPVWGPLNWILYVLLKAESFFAQYVNLPFGTSVYCLSVKPFPKRI